MKEHPISFTGAMVHAILGGRKTQTRRILKNPPIDHVFNEAALRLLKKQSPFGQIGDRLWVQETWKHGDSWHKQSPGLDWKNIQSPPGHVGECTWVDYAATPPKDFDDQWRSPKNMPRWASRITLEITNIRVDRLNDISEEDAFKEGIREGSTSAGYVPDLRQGFKWLWGSLNGEEAWEKNPWVWVIEFRRIK